MEKHMYVLNLRPEPRDQARALEIIYELEDKRPDLSEFTCAIDEHVTPTLWTHPSYVLDAIAFRATQTQSDTSFDFLARFFETTANRLLEANFARTTAALISLESRKIGYGDELLFVRYGFTARIARRPKCQAEISGRDRRFEVG